MRRLLKDRDLWLLASLVALCVTMRLLPHPPTFTPVAAAGLFAGATLRRRGALLAVPLLGMLLSDAVLGYYDWRLMGVVYGSLLVPVLLGMWLEGRATMGRLASAAAVGSVVFFLATNTAVWAFSRWYPHDGEGLVTCLGVALPFFKYTLLGDLFWVGMLFGCQAVAELWVAQRQATGVVAAVVMRR